MVSRHGNLGDGVLQRFNVAFDYPHKRMLLVRNERFADPFEWDMSGMRMQPDGDAAVRTRAVEAGRQGDRDHRHPRVRASAPPRPMASPAAAMRTPWTITMSTTSRRRAPRAMRMPNSRSRCDTPNEMTP